jgi:hypothetical protein
MKHLAAIVLTLAACVCALWLAPGPSHVDAQLGPGIEKGCPAGTYPLVGGTTMNASNGNRRQSFCVDSSGNITVNVETLQQAGVGPVFLPINLAGGAGVVTGTLPGANMSATNLAGTGNGGVTGSLPFTSVSGTATTAQIGTGTPAASKYVDGATDAWTVLPASAPSFLQAGAATFSPATSATYFFGQLYSESPSPNIALVSRIYVGRAGTLTRADYYHFCGAAAIGTFTLTVNINGTTDVLSANIAGTGCTAGVTGSATGSTAVNAGDYLTIKMVTPAAPPTGDRWTATVTVQ